MTLWLLIHADSATARVCLLIGCLVILVAERHSVKGKAAVLKVMALPSVLCVFLILEMGFNITDTVAQSLGRDPTLTDRTVLWQTLLTLDTNPLLGTGYESFWLGDRLTRIWLAYPSIQPNQAHNGYLEIYLNLGLVGLCLLTGFLIVSYWRIWSGLNSASNLRSLSLAVWTTLLFFNVTEAGFRSQILWILLLLGTVAVPLHAKRAPETYRAHAATAASGMLVRSSIRGVRRTESHPST